MLRKVLIGISLVLVLLGITRVRMEVDVLDLLPQEMREVQGLRLFLQHFSKKEELILTLESADAEALAEHHTSLAHHLRGATPSLGECLSEDVWTDASGDGLGELVAWLLVNATSPEKFANIVAALEPNARERILEDSLDTIANSLEFDEALTLSYDPYQLVQSLRREQEALTSGGDEFASADGTMRLLYLQAPADHPSTGDWVHQVKTTAQAWQAESEDRKDILLGFTGEPVFQTEIAASMERDMKISGISALLLTSIIFGLAYRRLRPLFALMTSLTLTFLLTWGIAGWVLSSMTVMSVGFASILIGLTVDYGVILYQTSLAKERTAAQLRKRTRGSIGWAALTTAAAFAALGFSAVPGIATLGQLVALGIIVGAVVMLGIYPCFLGSTSTQAPSSSGDWLGSIKVVTLVGLGILFLAVSPLWLGFPKLNTSTEALRPRDSAAYDTMDRLQARLIGGAGSELVILDLSEASLDAWETRLDAVCSNYTLPGALVPHPDWQSNNLDQLHAAHLNIDELRTAAEKADFEPEAMDLTDSILEHWRKWQGIGAPPAPTSPTATRLWSRMLATDTEGKPTYLLTTLTPKTGLESQVWDTLSDQSDSFSVSWPRITTELNERVPRDLRLVGLALGIAVLVMLVFTFRSAKEIGLALGTTMVTMLALCGAMRVLGWEWNFFSLGALLLTFGAGLDYSIHILLDRRHHGGEIAPLRQGVLRALGVCALSTIAGFASIAWASNQGLASLGRVCALALAINALVALVLLPWFLERFQPDGAV
jgi:predicted exporter